MNFKNFAAFAVILLATRIEGRGIPRAIVTTLPVQPEYDGDISPEFSDIPMARNDSDFNEDDRVEEYFTDRLEDDFENLTLWPENDDNNRSSSLFSDPTTSDDVDSNEDDHLQKSFTNPPTDENEDVSSSSLRPENDSLQESFTNSQKDENEKLTSSTPMPENDGNREPKYIPIPKADFTLEELKEMLEAKLNEDRRILDANKRKVENYHPQESLENSQKDEYEEVIPSPPWPENDGLASRLEDASTVSDDYDEYVDCFEEGCEEDIKEEKLVKTPTNPHKDKTWMEQNGFLVLGLVLAGLAAFFILLLCNPCSNSKQGKSNADSIDFEAKFVAQIQEEMDSVENLHQDQIESIKKDTELAEKEKLELIEKNVMVFKEYKESARQISQISSKNLKNANSYGKQSTNNVSIGSVALSALKLAAESPLDNNDEAVAPTTNFGSHGGCASRINKRHSTTSSGIGESIQTVKTISGSVDSQNRQLSDDKAAPKDSASNFVRGGVRKSRSFSDINKAAILPLGVVRRENLRKSSRPLSEFIQMETLKESSPEIDREGPGYFSSTRKSEVKAEVHRSSAESSPEATKKTLATTNSTY